MVVLSYTTIVQRPQKGVVWNAL